MSTNWNLIENEFVSAACQDAASYVARQYHGILEYEDALQEAYIAVATNADKVQTYLDGEQFSYLKRYIWERVTDVAKGYLRRRKNDVSLEALQSQWGERE